MDELVRETGLGKATVYRLFPTKDSLVAAYLRRLAEVIGAAIHDEVARRPADPAGALLAVIDAIEADLRRPDFRGCPFNNASVEYGDPNHPARTEARRYRVKLHERLTSVSEALNPRRGAELAATLAVLIDGVYTNAAHLGPDGPAAIGLAHARQLIRDARP